MPPGPAEANAPVKNVLEALTLIRKWDSILYKMLLLFFKYLLMFVCMGVLPALMSASQAYSPPRRSEEGNRVTDG